MPAVQPEARREPLRPVRNGEASLARRLARPGPFAEVVVIDRASADGARKIAEDQGARILDFRRQGGSPREARPGSPRRPPSVRLHGAEELLDDAFCDALTTRASAASSSGLLIMPPGRRKDMPCGRPRPPTRRTSPPLAVKSPPDPRASITPRPAAARTLLPSSALPSIQSFSISGKGEIQTEGLRGTRTPDRLRFSSSSRAARVRTCAVPVRNVLPGPRVRYRLPGRSGLHLSRSP